MPDDPPPSSCTGTMLRKKRVSKRLKRLFPLHIRNVVNFDAQGLYSTTEYEIAQSMTGILVNACVLHTGHRACSSDIVDGTAGIGGNSISFANLFRAVNAFELDYGRWMLLHKNIGRLGLGSAVSCVHGNFLTYQEVGLFRDTRVFFLDPPWGGLSYKRKAQLRLHLSGVPLHEVVNRMLSDDASICGLKVPYNFALGHFSENLDPRVQVRYISRYKHVWLVVCYLHPPPAPGDSVSGG